MTIDTGMSRAVVATAFGGPEVLSVIDVDVPAPGPGEVVVEVRAIGVNPIDHKVYSGAFGTDPEALPMRIGYEAAGVVTAVGPPVENPSAPAVAAAVAGADVATAAVGAAAVAASADVVVAVAVGDEVIAFRVSGAYADRIVVPAASLTPKPADLDWPGAAGLMLVGATAVHALTATAVGAGDTVLVHGGSGGVGLAAIQLAKARGARVIATASPARHELLRSLGADPVAYGDGLLERVQALAPDGVDAAIDTVGTDEALDTSVALVADRARIATIAAFARGGELGLKLLGGGPGADPGTQIRDAARATLVQLVSERRLVVPIAATYPLDDVQAAHRAVATGHAPGKIVLIP